MRYADDIAIPTESEEVLYYALNKLVEVDENYGLKEILRKSK